MTDSTWRIDHHWVPTDKNAIIRRSTARNRLRVGGTGSSKSSDSMMEIVQALLRWPGAFALILRRTFDDLLKANIPDLKSYIPADLYKYNESNHILKLYNGSCIFFGHMQHFNQRDLEQYLSASFPFILIDECGAFPGEVWTYLQTRNRVNPQCQVDSYGTYPVPFMLGATNPIGAHWGWYNDYFVLHKPDEVPEGSKRDKNGRYWLDVDGQYQLVYNPDEYAHVHSTIYDNPHMLEKDPGIVSRLMALPSVQREKFLYGYMDRMVGQYFDCFDQDTDVINLREDPEAIIWQYWQPRWLGWDWGRAHWSATYWFTKALVRRANGEYKLKTVCYREMVERGKDYFELAAQVARLTKMGLPGMSDADRHKTADYRQCYFSHEKFAKIMESESPAVKLTKELMQHNLSGVTRATTDRIGRASLLYNLLKRRELVILDTCPELIRAIPTRTRDDKQIEDVLKVEDKGDDVYDGASLGLFGMLGETKTPREELDKRKIESAPDEFTKVLAQVKVSREREARTRSAEERRPDWI